MMSRMINLGAIDSRSDWETIYTDWFQPFTEVYFV